MRQLYRKWFCDNNSLVAKLIPNCTENRKYIYSYSYKIFRLYPTYTYVCWNISSISNFVIENFLCRILQPKIIYKVFCYRKFSIYKKICYRKFSIYKKICNWKFSVYNKFVIENFLYIKKFVIENFLYIKKFVIENFLYIKKFVIENILYIKNLLSKIFYI